MTAHDPLRCSICGRDHSTTIEWLACIHVNPSWHPARDVGLTVERRDRLDRYADDSWRAALDVVPLRARQAAA